MERELFGGESSVEEEDSSDESSDGEEEKRQAGQQVEHVRGAIMISWMVGFN